MRLSDLIEQILKDNIQANEGQWTFSRNALANELNCVPSQVSYVISTRFTSGKGYLVESKRGGGGSIRIQQIVGFGDDVSYLMHTLQSLGKEMTQHDVEVSLQNFIDYEVVSPSITRVMMAALTDQALVSVHQSERDQVRAELFRNMLMQLALDAQ